MHDTYLEIMYRKGKQLAAYLYLTGFSAGSAIDTKELMPGLLADFDANGHPLGIEIAAPGLVSVQQIRKALDDLECYSVDENELLPLKAA